MPAARKMARSRKHMIDGAGNVRLPDDQADPDQHGAGRQQDVQPAVSQELAQRRAESQFAAWRRRRRIIET